MRHQPPKSLLAISAPTETPVSLASTSLPKKLTHPVKAKTPILVIMGDPQLPDLVKREGKFNPEDFESITEIKQNLRKLKQFRFTYINEHEKLMERLIRAKPSFAFNLCDEGFNNQAQQELHIPALLELLNIPYSGAGPACLALCYNKAAVNGLAYRLNIPTPIETYYGGYGKENPKTMPERLVYPVFVKPNYGDGSFGIPQQALIQNEAALQAHLHALTKKLPKAPLLIQEYLSGAEYSVGVIGNVGSLKVLPILEIDFSQLPADLPKIFCYESKWDPTSLFWQKIDFKQAILSKELKTQLTHYATLLFEHLGCRDYARFDFRTDAKGKIKLLEANPNPGIYWLSLMAKYNDISYPQLLEEIIMVAKKRYHFSDPR